MPGVLSTITIGIDPTIEIGPLTLAWHGITIALGILIGGVGVLVALSGGARLWRHFHREDATES